MIFKSLKKENRPTLKLTEDWWDIFPSLPFPLKSTELYFMLAKLCLRRKFCKIDRVLFFFGKINKNSILSPFFDFFSFFFFGNLILKKASC